ncbi:DNA-3-methyladenine glycosylase [Pseudogracilibacillus sp. SE30717A]|uniref:DNA-3-methyladenine glycosylase n=1 Tax=Pseudogracilibacillus sp. SE30717A TaxID=3098293 RepID=UPI00300DD7EB
MKPVDTSFFDYPCIDLAQQLLGHYLVHQLPSQTLIGRIVETEAYKGPQDQAAHSFNNRRTKRTEIMFDRPGLAYIYQMHTHTLINVVAGPIGVPHAVLIRALEPIQGITYMRLNRPKIKNDFELTNGPGKLTKALHINMNYYGHALTDKPLYIVEGKTVNEIDTSPRVGVRNTGEAADYPWRFFEKNNPFVSKFR